MTLSWQPPNPRFGSNGYLKQEYHTIWRGDSLQGTEAEVQRDGTERWAIEVTEVGSGNSIGSRLSRQQLQELHKAIGEELGI